MRLLATIPLSVCMMFPFFLPAMTPEAFDELMQEVELLQEEGRLQMADEKVREALDVDSLDSRQRRTLEYELVRSERIARDYSVTEDRLRSLLKELYRDVTDEEITEWIDEGRFDRKEIGGEWRYVGASLSNLFFRYPDVRERRIEERSTNWTEYLLEHIPQVMQQARPDGNGLAEPIRYEITMTIAVRPDVVPEGEVIRCWMPYPMQFAAQDSVRLVSSSPEITWMNAPDYPVRSIYFEQPSRGSEETLFTATYRVTVYPRSYNIDPMLVERTDQKLTEDHAFFTSEEPPHIVFSPRIRELAEEIVGEETNPALKARRIYDWLAENLKYSYAREYSTLRCIPEYVLENGYGDCGQIALTFIALCRAAGVPARWQSGWVIYPTWNNLHDWTEIYLAPYGWVPVDPDFAVGFQQTHDYLEEEEVKRLQDFYFGGLDGHRLTINRRHGYPHYPPKRDFRSDDVDFQRGELETASGENIYFGKFRYRLEKRILSGAPEEETTAAPVEPAGQQGPAVPGLVR